MNDTLSGSINDMYRWMGAYNVSLAFLIFMMYVMAGYMLFRCLRRMRFLAVMTFLLQGVLVTMATLVLLEKVMVIPAFEALFIIGGFLVPMLFLLADFAGMKRRARVSGKPVPLVARVEKKPVIKQDPDWMLRTDAPGPLYPAGVVGRNLHSPDATVLSRAREQLQTAERMLAEGDQRGAEGIYTSLASLVPLDARGLCNAGWLSHRMGKQDEAIRLFRHALPLARKESRKGDAAEDKGSEWTAEETEGTTPGEKAAEATEGTTPVEKAAEATEGVVPVETPYAQVSRKVQPAWFARFGIACAQFALTDWENALFGFQKAMVTGGESAELLLNMARCHLHLDVPELARKELEKALVMDDHPDTRLALARLFLQMSLREGALAQLEHLTQTDRNRPDAWRMLGTLYRREENWSKAEPCFTQLVKLQPENADAWFRLGTCRRHLDRYEDALQCFRTTIRFKPDHSRAFYGAAAIHEERGGDGEAISLLKQAIAGDEPMEKSYNLLASIYEKGGRIREAVAVYLEAVSRFPEDGLLQANLGSAQMLAGFHDRALKPFKNAIRLGENDVGVYTMWAKALFELKHAHEAVRVLKEATTAWPEDASLMYLSARAKARCHDTNGAIGDLESAVRMDPELRLEARACGDFATIRTAPGFIDLIRLPYKKGNP